MKKIIAMLLILSMLTLPAFAQEIPGAQMLDPDIKNEIDLDGDGAAETITIKKEGVDGEEYLALYLFGADGSFYSYDMYALWLERAFVMDVDGNGLKELFVVCDFYSDDYVTYCFNYDDVGGLMPLWFTGMSREGYTQAYAEDGYGKVTGVNEDVITLTGSLDVLGTWMASREYLFWKGRFELIEGPYMIQTNEEDWEYRPLILKQNLEATLPDGSAAVFPAGEKFLITATDGESIAHLVTRDGLECSVNIRFNEETGWGWFVNGIYEEDLFEYVPYAD